jgi:hypothetical protein
VRWVDCSRLGRWGHSLLYSDEGVYLAQCWDSRNMEGQSRGVRWDTENGRSGLATNRNLAKRAAKRAVKDDR